MKNYFFLSSIWEGRAVGRFENLMGASSNRRSYNGTGFASISAKIWGGGYDCPPDFRRLWWESGEQKKIGTKTVIGFLFLVLRHIFEMVIRRHFLIGIFDHKLGGPICFGTFDVCLFSSP